MLVIIAVIVVCLHIVSPYILSNVAARRLLLLYICEVPASNLGSATSYSDRGFCVFSQFLHLDVSIVL
jgi:hypothetical protein